MKTFTGNTTIKMRQLPINLLKYYVILCWIFMLQRSFAGLEIFISSIYFQNTYSKNWKIKRDYFVGIRTLRGSFHSSIEDHYFRVHPYKNIYTTYLLSSNFLKFFIISSDVHKKITNDHYLFFLRMKTQSILQDFIIQYRYKYIQVVS